MVKEIIFPKMGVSDSGKITSWIKKMGDTVHKGEGVVEVMAEKVNVVIEAPADGVITKILAEEGQEVPAGATLALMD